MERALQNRRHILHDRPSAPVTRSCCDGDGRPGGRSRGLTPLRDRRAAGSSPADGLVRPQSRQVAPAVRSAESRRVLQPADRAAPSDRVLRRPPARLQLQHAGQARPWPARHRRPARSAVRARHRSPRIARVGSAFATRRSASSGRRAPSVQAVRARSRPPGARRARAGRHRSAGPSAARPRRSGATASSSTRRCTRRRCSTCGIACRSQPSAGPTGYAPLTERHHPRHRRGSTCRPATATLGADARRDPFAWDNERPAHHQHVAAFADRASQRDQRRASWRSSTPAATATERWWRPRTGTWRCTASRSSIRRSGSTIRTAAGSGAACSTACRCRPRGRSTSARPRPPPTRAWRGARLPTEAEYQRAAYGDPKGGERTYPWGERRPRPTHGVFDFASWDPQPAGSHPGGASAWGVDDLVGNGWEWTSTVFAPFPGFSAMASYPEYSADFFDGEHVRDEGRVAGDGAPLCPAVVPQLVPAALSLCLCDLPLRARRPDDDARQRPRADRHGRCRRHDRGFRHRGPALPDASSRGSCRRAFCTIALGSALFDAICQLPWYRVTAGETRLLATTRRRDPVAAPAAHADRRTRRRQRRQAGGHPDVGAGHEPRRSTLHLIDVSPAALATASRALSAVRPGPRLRPRVDLRGRACAGSAANRAAGRTLVLFLGSNIGNFDPDGAAAFLRQARAALRPGDALLLGADLVKPEAELLLAYDDPLGVTAAFNRNLLVRINRELGADFDLRRLRASRGLERGRVARRDAPGQRHPPERTRRGRRARPDPARGGIHLDREFLQVHDPRHTCGVGPSTGEYAIPYQEHFVNHRRSQIQTTNRFLQMRELSMW